MLFRSCASRRAHRIGGNMAAYNGKITAMRDNGSSTDIVVHVNDANMAADIKTKNIHDVSLRLTDGRTISLEQRKKIYATLKDISLYTGYYPEETKEVMKYYYIQQTGNDYFSLSDCSLLIARDFINVLIDFCLKNGVITSEALSTRTDDIDTYLYQCIRRRKCAVCGKDGELHHWDAIGMGHDRRNYDDSKNKKMCLCRVHHTIAHQKGKQAFERDYHVYGIVVKE